MRFVGSSCRSAARTSRPRIALWNPPPSSSFVKEERHPHPWQERMYTFVPTAIHTLQRERSERSERIRSFPRWLEEPLLSPPSTPLARLAEAGDRQPLPSSLAFADERRVCSLARLGQPRASLAQLAGARSGVQFLASRLANMGRFAFRHTRQPSGDGRRRSKRIPQSALSQHFQSQEERLDALCSVNCLQCANRGA
jgi:hypothetical protein